MLLKRKSDKNLKFELLQTARDGRAKSNQYIAFLYHFVPCLISSKTFKSKCRTELLSQYFTISDEGFLFVVLENYIHNWYDKYTIEDKAKQKPAVSAVESCE